MKFLRLLLGICLFSLGIVMTINANLGIAPWDTFHQGVSLQSGLTFGQASILVGLLILLINYFLDQLIGLGTILNIFGIGIMIDLLFKYKIVPTMNSSFSGTLLMIIGMFVIAIGSYFYLSAGLGAGPRDGLMVGLLKKVKFPIGLIRALIEITVLIIGSLLGGKVGYGTVILAFGIGPIIQLTFSMLKFDVKEVKHLYILKNKIR